jgi:hypothetical protein
MVLQQIIYFASSLFSAFGEQSCSGTGHSAIEYDIPLM